MSRSLLLLVGAAVQLFLQLAGASAAQCASLLAALGVSKVLYPVNPLYEVSLLSYYAQQEEQLTPDCIVTPADAQDVSTAIKILSAAYLETGSQCELRRLLRDHFDY
jgi:hypothetical protein